MTKEIKLSERLKTIASFLPKGTFFADIGSDHGFLPCYICLRDKEAHAIAGEVSEGPYERTVQTVNHYELSNRIDVRLGDGLEVIKPEDNISELIIAGMGGGLISEILINGSEKLSTVHQLILQPNNHADYVRRLLVACNYPLINEVIIEENNHIYEILVAVRDRTVSHPYTKDDNMEKQIMFGPYLMEEKSLAFIKKWKKEHEKISKVMNHMRLAKNVDEQKVNDYRKRLKWIEEVLI